MSPWWVKAPVPSLCFPCVSGDEPRLVILWQSSVRFSPREGDEPMTRESTPYTVTLSPRGRG